MAAAVLAVLLLALAILWSERKPIARDFVDRELTARGVPGRYAITRFGVTSQRLEHVSIGDPRDPDLTADWAEIGIAFRLGLPRLRAVSAGGVRLRGRLVDGKLSLGALDRLLPAPTGAPFVLPDLDVDLDDARMRLETPYGPVGLALSGSGRLSDGFTGRLAAVTRTLDVAGCRTVRATAFVNIAITDRRPRLDGPLRAARIDCAASGVVLTGANLGLDATLVAALDSWTGNAQLAVVSAARGGDRLGGISGRIGFAGTAARMGGDAALAAQTIRASPVVHGSLKLAGRWQLAGAATRFVGTLGLCDAGLAADVTRALAASRDLALGTPAGPLWRTLAPALAGAAERADLTAGIALASGADAGSLRLISLSARSASGGRADLNGGGAIYSWPLGVTRIDGTLTLGGGGMPDGRIRLVQSRPGGPIAGSATFAPYAVSGARLALTPVRFTLANGGGRFATEATLDGPVADGRVDGLRLPVAGRFGSGGFVIGEGCVPLAFSRLAVAGLVLGPSRLPLCPSGGALVRGGPAGISGGATIASPRLSGRIGGAPATIAAARLAITLGKPGFAADALAVRIGAGDTVTRLDVATLTGGAGADGIAGRFAGAGGNIGAVPLLLSDGAGPWTLRAGVLTLGGHLRLADRAAVARFNPLISDDVALRLAGGRIAATGHLVEPHGGAAVSTVTLAHDLATGRGNAVLDVPGIDFNPRLQPEALTPLTIGVIANVQGKLSGRGDVRWTADGATSDGRFRTDGLALAAAFGPVTGLKGEIVFSDLLALATPPGQVATIGEVNPGVAVTGGVVRYQLLPDQLVKVEGGRWPFAGGELLLDPSTLDLGRPSDRRLTFRIVGLDAAQFVQQFELKNIALTGTFDGVMPMLFDATGGRIVGGRLAVRKTGGTLAYVGEVSNAKLGMFARLAFDALRSMRYQALAIDLDGALDGELISKVIFDGTNETPGQAKGGGLLAKFTNLPFRFNITIRAPFRGLLNSAASLNDPRGLIGSQLPKPPTPASVQPQESETVP